MPFLETEEQDIELGAKNSIHDIERNLSNITGLEYDLGEPLSYFEDERLTLMHSNERQFAKLLLSKGLLVFYEPHIKGVDRVPDFYIINQRSYSGDLPYCGKFIEITLCKKEDVECIDRRGSKRYARKRRQREVFESLGIPIVYMYSLGIPIVYMYLEEQQEIRKSQDYIRLF
ncbi:MAG: hypothetical protein PHP08_04575 [Candidatus Dojkabacteria bacterium]|nr:hypothetical protein [Candidatus Dojkabacteria bacterium]